MSGNQAKYLIIGFYLHLINKLLSMNPLKYMIGCSEYCPNNISLNNIFLLVELCIKLEFKKFLE